MEKKNTIAMIGFIIGCANYICCCCFGAVLGIAGIICSIIGYNNAKDGVYSEKYSYRTFAVAGIVMNAIAIVGNIIIAILQLFTGMIGALAEAL